jgi:hypothetical protein
MGRPSRSLTLDQALALLSAAGESRLNAYVVLSLTVGIRTEEARELRWDHVDLEGSPKRTVLSRRLWPCGVPCVRCPVSRAIRTRPCHRSYRMSAPRSAATTKSPPAARTQT